MKFEHFSKLMKLNVHLLLCSKRHWWNWISSFTYMWGKTPIWIEHNLISIPPKQLGLGVAALFVSKPCIYFSLQIIVCSLFSLAYNYGLFKKISKNSMEYSCNFGWQSIPPSPSKRVIFRVVVELSVKPWSIKSNFCNSQPSESIRHWRRFNRPP